MNPYPYNNNSFSNFQTNQRDKTKSYFQPLSQNNFIGSYSNNQSGLTNNINGQNNTSSYHQSDKYKSFYNQYQDYRQSSISQIQKIYTIPTSNDKSLQKNRSNFFFQDKFSSTSPVGFQQNNHINLQKSIDRKRLYTNPGQINSWKKESLNQFTENLSSYNSIITNNSQKQIHKQSLTNNSNFKNNLNDSQTINPKKDLFKFINQKFAASRVQSTVNSRQKKNQLNHNKSEYLQKANKKISLKKDQPVNSPKYKQVDLKSQNFVSKKEQIQNQRHRTTSFFQPIFNKKIKSLINYFINKFQIWDSIKIFIIFQQLNIC